MVSDLKGAVSLDVDMSEDKAIEKAEEVLWRARLESFQAHFEKDLVTLKRAIHGHGLLQDKRWSRIGTHWWATFRTGWVCHFQLRHRQQVHQPLQWILWLKHMLWPAWTSTRRWQGMHW